MRPLVRTLVFVLAAVSLLPPAAPARGQAGWQEEVSALLERRAAALLARDEAAFLASARGAPKDFLDAQREWFRRIGSVPLSAYRLELAFDEFGDLARSSDGRRYGGEVHIVQVKERIGLRGYDRDPSNEDLFLTVARRPDGWSVVSDSDVEELALQSSRNLWDFGSVRVAQSGGIMVVYHPAEEGAARAILSSAGQARARVRRSWPFPWNEGIAIMIPSTVTELARILQTTFDLSTFVAFAASSIDRSEGWRLSGHRVFLHWPNFRRYSARFQQQILAHEFTHLATRSITGPFVPALLDEGVAQHYGEGGGETDQLRRRVRARTLSRRLVSDWFFFAGPAADIHLAYEEAASFSAFLAERFGSDAPARAYRALGAIDPVSVGTWRYHLDRALQGLFERSFASLESEWGADVYRELS